MFRTDPQIVQIVEELITMGANPTFTLLNKFVSFISSERPSTNRGYEIAERRKKALSILLNNHRLDTALLARLLHTSIGDRWATEILLQTKGVDVEAKDDLGEQLYTKQFYHI